MNKTGYYMLGLLLILLLICYFYNTTGTGKVTESSYFPMVCDVFDRIIFDEAFVDEFKLCSEKHKQLIRIYLYDSLNFDLEGCNGYLITLKCNKVVQILNKYFSGLTLSRIYRLRIMAGNDAYNSLFIAYGTYDTITQEGSIYIYHPTTNVILSFDIDRKKIQLKSKGVY